MPSGCNILSCLISNATSIGVNVTNTTQAIVSNDWYLSPIHTAIRGITIFGSKYMSFVVRVVYQGGVPVSAPISVNLNNLVSFNAGSAFIPLDIDVPAGALIGVDFTIPIN